MTDIDEGNKLIAQFMGGYMRDMGKGDMIWGHPSYLSPLVCKYPSELEYHINWTWLMPVVEKIESLYDEFHGYFGVHISSNTCTIQGTKLNTASESFHPAYLSDPNAVLGTKLKSTWYNIVQFIKWYNNHVSCSNGTIQ